MSRISYFFRGLKKVLLHTYVVAGRRLLKNTVICIFTGWLEIKDVWIGCLVAGWLCVGGSDGGMGSLGVAG